MTPDQQTAPPSLPAEIEDRGQFTGGGLIIPKHPQITVGGRRRALRTGTYERKESDAVKRIVTEADTILELGGGIGYMSTLLAKTCGARHVHTFEANPTLLPYMARFHALNGVTDKVTVHHALLGETGGGTQAFYVRRNFLSSSMEAGTGAYEQEVQIETRGLNETLGTLAPDVLVCDIEGAEAHLLPLGDFSGLRAAVIELHPQWIGQAGVQAVFDTMHRAGLTYFHRGSEGKVVVFRRGF